MLPVAISIPPLRSCRTPRHKKADCWLSASKKRPGALRHSHSSRPYQDSPTPQKRSGPFEVLFIVRDFEFIAPGMYQTSGGAVKGESEKNPGIFRDGDIAGFPN